MKRNLGIDNVKTQNERFLEKMHKISNKMEIGLKTISQSSLESTFGSPEKMHGNHSPEDRLISKTSITKDKENKLNITFDSDMISK